MYGSNVNWQTDRRTDRTDSGADRADRVADDADYDNTLRSDDGAGAIRNAAICPKIWYERILLVVIVACCQHGFLVKRIPCLPAHMLSRVWISYPSCTNIDIVMTFDSQLPNNGTLPVKLVFWVVCKANDPADLAHENGSLTFTFGGLCLSYFIS